MISLLDVIMIPRKTLRRTVIVSVAMCCMTGAALAQAQPAKPQPDTVIFKNGDRLTGTLISGSGNSIVFKSDMSGQITISLDNVKELQVHGSFTVLKNGIPLKERAVRQQALPGTLTYADGALTVQSPSGTSSSVPEKDLNVIVDQPTFQKSLQRQSLLKGWTGSANAGVTDTQATSYGTTFTLGAALQRQAPQATYLPPHDRQTLNVSETYGKLTQPVIPNPDNLPASVAKTSIFHTDFEYDRYFSPRFYALGDLSFDHNFSLGLNLQDVYGGGFGWTPIKTPKQQLDLKVDVHYEQQQFLADSGTPSQNLIGSTFSEAYKLTLPKNILLTENVSLLPAWNNTNAYSGNGALNLALPAYHKLTVNLGLTDAFINDPPQYYQKNSFTFTTGIGYTF